MSRAEPAAGANLHRRPEVASRPKACPASCFTQIRAPGAAQKVVGPLSLTLIRKLSHLSHQRAPGDVEAFTVADGVAGAARWDEGHPCPGFAEVASATARRSDDTLQPRTFMTLQHRTFHGLSPRWRAGTVDRVHEEAPRRGTEEMTRI
jgi:hypothetical protein